METARNDARTEVVWSMLRTWGFCGRIATQHHAAAISPRHLPLRHARIEPAKPSCGEHARISS